MTADVLVLSFSRIVSDARVLKQVRMLSGRYRVTTCGFGPAPDGVARHHRIPDHLVAWHKDRLMLLLRRYRKVYWDNEVVRFAFRELSTQRFDVVLADDVETVPLAQALDPRAGVHADLHEYAPGQNSENVRWRLFVAPYVRWLCRRFVARAGSVTTVGAQIAERYRRELGIPVEVVVNATPYAALEPAPVSRPLRLVHSGNAQRNRHLDIMIDAVEAADREVHLDLLLMPNDAAYLAELKSRTASSRRVRVLDPVPYEDLVATLNAYDVGVFVLPPVNVNYELTLPNKFYDFVQARLGVVVGPSPEMAREVTVRGFGAVTADFSPDALRRLIDGLEPSTVEEWKKAAHASARELSAEVQSAGWLTAVDSLLDRADGREPSAPGSGR